MDINEMIKEFKTPFYLYDIAELNKRIEMMRDYQKDIGLCFAMKASPVLAGYIAPFVDRLEVCSPGEYEICVRDKVSAEKILISGVNKTRESMRRILSLGGAAGFFTIESPEHFEILEAVTREIKEDATSVPNASSIPNASSTPNGKLRIYIRLTSGNQFGVDRETLEELCEKVNTSQYMELIGIHYFSGTQKNLKKIEKELTELTEYGKILKEKFGKDFSLEYGPGLGIDYFKEINTPLSHFNEEDMKGLMDIVEKTGLKDSYSDITFEYGRYIAATCGKYYTGVADVKTNDGTNYAILEGGLHQITYYGSMAGMKVPSIDYISKTSDSTKMDEVQGELQNELQDYVLAGSLCSVNDILVRKVSLPKLDIGDSLCFNLTGAYSATEGISLFLSRDLPAIIVQGIDGKVALVREHTETNIYNGGF